MGNSYDEGERRRTKKTREEKMVEAGPSWTQIVEAKTEAQGHYLLSIASKTVTFGVGPSGTGKTMLAAAAAADAFLQGHTNKIIVTRPAIETGDTLGFLPGTLDEKFAPYIAPVYGVLLARMGKGPLEYALKAGQIETTPLELMRGMNFNDTWVVLDEAQNATISQMKMFLTRIGKNAKVIINGDPNQCDLECQSGLTDALNRVTHIEDIGHVQFTHEDVVRSRLVKQILASYEE